MKKIVLVALIGIHFLLAGCTPSEKTKQTLKQVETVSKALEQEFGQRPYVTATYKDDKLFAITIKFSEPHPRASHQALARFTAPLVTSVFKQEPEELNFEFVTSSTQ